LGYKNLGSHQTKQPPLESFLETIQQSHYFFITVVLLAPIAEEDAVWKVFESGSGEKNISNYIPITLPFYCLAGVPI